MQPTQGTLTVESGKVTHIPRCFASICQVLIERSAVHNGLEHAEPSPSYHRSHMARHVLAVVAAENAQGFSLTRARLKIGLRPFLAGGAGGGGARGRRWFFLGCSAPFFCCA